MMGVEIHQRGVRLSTVHDTKGFLAEGLARALREENVNALLAFTLVDLGRRGGGMLVNSTVIKDVLER
jgi:hypothetical protein